MFWASSGSLSSTNEEFPLMLSMRRSRTIEDNSSVGSVCGVDNPSYRRSGSVFGRSGSSEEEASLADGYGPVKRHKRERQYSQFSDDFVPPMSRVGANRMGGSVDSILSVRNGTVKSHQRLGPVARKVSTHKVQDPRSASLDSLLQDFGVVQVDCMSWNVLDLEAHSVSKDDLVLEDIEDSEEDCLDDSQSALLLHENTQSQVVIQSTNENYVNDGRVVRNEYNSKRLLPTVNEILMDTPCNSPSASISRDCDSGLGTSMPQQGMPAPCNICDTYQVNNNPVWQIKSAWSDYTGRQSDTSNQNSSQSSQSAFSQQSPSPWPQQTNPSLNQNDAWTPHLSSQQTHQTSSRELSAAVARGGAAAGSAKPADAIVRPKVPDRGTRNVFPVTPIRKEVNIT